MVPLDRSSTLHWAEEKTGLTEAGDAKFFRFLDTSIEAVNENRDLSVIGRLAARRVFRQHITTRLRAQALLREHPEIRDVRIERPIFIVGLYRTGTTFLHNLMALDENHRSPRAWELIQPLPVHSAPDKDYAERHRAGERFFGLHQRVMPDMKNVHYVGPDDPEECFFLLENECASTLLVNTFYCLNYGRWLFHQDLSHAYESLRTYYQVMAWNKAPEQWVMKCPFHAWNLDALLHAFPDARFVFTHRPIKKALPSVCSLSAKIISKFTHSFDVNAIGRFWLSSFEDGIIRSQRARSRMPESRIFDLRLGDLSQAPEPTLRKLYDHFDLRWSPGLSNAISTLPKKRGGQTSGTRHDYTPEDFGLRTHEIDERFAAYEERFGIR